METDVAIVGGGLAGLACALGLAGSGLRVTVLEAGESCGGRARSWTHAPTGDAVDIGPHIFLSHYPNMLELLTQLGTRDRICWQRDRLITLLKDGEVDVMRVHRLPSPLHLVPSLLRARAVRTRDKLSNWRTSWAALKLDESRVLELDRLSAAEFVRENRVSDEFTQWFWNSVSMSLMNTPLEACSAGALMRVYAQLLGHNDYAIGFANCGLSDLYVDQARSRIEQHGGAVLTNHRAETIKRTGTRFAVHVTDRECILARQVVAAVPPEALARITRDLAPLAALRTTARAFQPSPYVSVYLWLDRKITDLKFWAGTWTPQRLNYDFYDLSNIRTGWQQRPSVITSNIIHNTRAQAMSDDDLVGATCDEIAEFAPAMRNARVLHAETHRIEMAIPCPTVGAESQRPPTQTAVSGFHVAGDWTRTGLPCSMESAVRSGWLASEAVWRDIGQPRSLAIPPPLTRGLPGLIRQLANRRSRAA